MEKAVLKTLIHSDMGKICCNLILEEGALYFHPKDFGKEVLEKYRVALDKHC